MILDDFLDAIEECPDDELYSRFGIGENYTILLRADWKRVVRDLDASDKWEYNPEEIGLEDLGEHRLYDDISNVVTLQSLSWVVPCPGVEGIEEYNMSFMIVYNATEGDGLSEETSSLRLIANAVKEIICYAKENEIPVCFPNSSLTGNQDEFISTDRDYRVERVPGQRIDPAGELKHYSGNILSPYIRALKMGKTIDLESDRRDLCAMLDRFSDGTYTYRETEHFNPEVASRLKEMTEGVMTEGVTVEPLRDLLGAYIKTANDYLIDTDRADETTDAMATAREQFLQERG